MPFRAENTNPGPMDLLGLAADWAFPDIRTLVLYALVSGHNNHLTKSTMLLARSILCAEGLDRQEQSQAD